MKLVSLVRVVSLLKRVSLVKLVSPVKLEPNNSSDTIVVIQIDSCETVAVGCVKTTKQLLADK